MSTFLTWRRGRAAAALAVACTAVLVLSACGSSAGGEAAPGGTPSGTASENLRVVDLLDTTFDLGAMGIAPVATPFLDRAFAERVLAELELPADIEQQILAAELVNTGDGINTERVAALDPDVILLSETSVGTFNADPEALRQFGKVVFIPENLSWQERTKAIGEAVGRGPQAEQLVAEAQRSIDELGTLVQQSGVAGETVSPMRLDVAGFGVLALIPPSIGSSIIAAVGLAQPAAQTGNPPLLAGVADYYALTKVSFEKLPEHDADVIIALTRGGADPTAAVNDNALWKSMSAVQADRVVEAPWLVWALNSATGVQQITSDLTEATKLLQQQ